jgi:Ni,Fe-hydrogenase maturation factor
VAAITIAIAVHNVPEGLAITAVMRPRGVSLVRCAGWSVFSSLPQPLLAVPAFLFVQTFAAALPYGLGFAAGAMMFMVFEELLPEAYGEAPRAAVAALASLFLVAMVCFSGTVNDNKTTPTRSRPSPPLTPPACTPVSGRDHATNGAGVGDARRGDDAFGPHVLRNSSRIRLTPISPSGAGVSMRTLPLLSSVGQVLLVTAVRVGGTPGALHRLEWHGRPEDLGPRLPAIRRSGIEVLRSLHFWVDPVPELVVLGVESETTTGGALSPLVALAVHPTMEACVAELRRWGHEATPRAAPERVRA